RSTRIDLGKNTLVRLNTHGKRLELVVDPELAWLLQQGDDVPIDDVVEGFIFFENFSKGLKAGIDELTEIFGTENEREMAKIMIQKGELQITQEQRKRFLKEKRDEIIAYLNTHAVNPKTKTPHPPNRIEKAIDDAGCRINRNDPVKEQALRILKEIQSIIPIQIESASIEFIVPPKDTGRLYGVIQSFGEVVNENWGNDGSLTLVVNVPAGIVATTLEEISDKSKGRVRSTVLTRG
ncbi:MAG: ribosome assembly factor SBDS, partial [Candidatus Heimdallarchaeota archaeon]|nr:ribosome assembly factor SBDS [Candidatus Heimdallarchaeota archaeon]